MFSTRTFVLLKLLHSYHRMFSTRLYIFYYNNDCYQNRLMCCDLADPIKPQTLNCVLY